MTVQSSYPGSIPFHRSSRQQTPVQLWCRRPDSNRDGTFVPTDFKSDASTNSATSARVAFSTARRRAPSLGSTLAGVTPHFFPDRAGRIGHTAILLVELVRHLEDREHQSALRAPGRMP